MTQLPPPPAQTDAPPAPANPAGAPEAGGAHEVVAVVAVARNGVIGDGRDVPWHVPADLRRVKALTTGHPLVMGRATYEAIGRPLPGRTSVVLTRDPTWTPAGDPDPRLVRIVHDIPQALAVARRSPGGEYTVIFGGGQVYAACLEACTRLEVTEIDLAPSGSTRFPVIDPQVWRESAREPHEGYAFVTYERR